MKQPNILWICTDQQRFDTLGCYGNPFVETPNIDALAARGALIEHCYCQSPVCTPSRASFLTGRYPRTTRCRQNGQDIPDTEVLVTRLLANGGYRCGLAGKLHLSACHPSVCPVMERRIDDGYSVFHWSHDDGGNWGLHNAYWRWLDDHGHTYTTPPHPDCEFIRRGMPEPLSQSAWCADRAIDFIRESAQREGPWLFSVNFFDPHHPFNPAPEALARFEPMLDDIPLPNYSEGELQNKSVWQRIDHRAAYGGNSPLRCERMTPRDHRWLRSAYWAMVETIDRQVGRMLVALDETKQRDNTLVIFMSDHGEMLGDHGIYLKGPYFYEEAVRVPLIVSLPGVVQPARVGGLVELVDLAPTLLDAADLPRHPGMQGISLCPLLTRQGQERPIREDVYSAYYNAMHWHQQPPAHATMLRTDEFKLVLHHGLKSGELYDLTADPREVDNRWDHPETQPIKTDLLLRLADRMAWTVDPLPPRRSAW